MLTILLRKNLLPSLSSHVTRLINKIKVSRCFSNFLNENWLPSLAIVKGHEPFSRQCGSTCSHLRWFATIISLPVTDWRPPIGNCLSYIYNLQYAYHFFTSSHSLAGDCRSLLCRSVLQKTCRRLSYRTLSGLAIARK